MANLNKVLLLGNLTRDPEVRYTPKGTAVGDLGLAVNRRVSDGNGNWSDEVTFVDVTVWGTNAENAQKFLTKGRGVFIEGRLQLEQWDDKQTGQKRSKLKVVGEVMQFLPDGRNPDQREQGKREQTGQRETSSAPAGDYFDQEDDIPF